jgi:RHS repeat-associated protein
VGFAPDGTYVATFDRQTRFLYDGSGSRVVRIQSDSGGITRTVYAGDGYEYASDGATSETTKYYSLVDRRVAMRDSQGVSYLHLDNLGSTMVTSGAASSSQRYLPYGGQRGAAEVATDRRYTGQRWQAQFGLYDYNARWYDPGLRRFVQPDTVVPEPGNPQSLNRYAYALNNPVRYSDPTGRYTFEEDPEDPWVFDDASVRSRYWYTHPESKVGQPSDAEIIAAMTAPLWVPVAVVGGMVAGEALLAAGAAASTAVGGIVSGLAADGDPTNEVCAVTQVLGADGDPFNEIRTGSNVVYRYMEGGVTRYVGITDDFARRASEHLSGRGWTIEPIEGLLHLSRSDALAAEQTLIEHYRLGNLYNMINSVAQGNPAYGEAVRRGKELLSRIGYFGR